MLTKSSEQRDLLPLDFWFLKAAELFWFISSIHLGFLCYLNEYEYIQADFFNY